MLYTHYMSWRYRFERAWGRSYWREDTLMPLGECNARIGEAIARQQPYCVGKMGNNERKLIQWHTGTSSRFSALRWPVFYFETLGCLTNAGAKPRTRDSYHELGALFVDTLQNTDLLGLFALAGEHGLASRYAPETKFCQHLAFTPYFFQPSWARQLAGKRVFVVSPFVDSFAGQMKKRKEIWPDHEVLQDFEIVPYKFPYLVDQSFQGTWQSVYRDVVKQMEASEFDVALFGCGALGYPLASQAKKYGKVGIHLGGTLQVMFGVKGRRYESMAHFREFLNDAWVYPSDEETPTSATKIENSCYWK